MLRESSNPIEYKMSPYIERYFPNYDILWDSFLKDGIGQNGNWKDGPFERLGISNYGILKSLNFVRNNYDSIKVNDENQTFKNIYFHFGIICELITYACRYSYEFLTQLGVQLPIINFKSDGIEDKEAKSIIKVFITNQIEFNGLFTFYEEITKYRHFFTHNPGIDIILNYGILKVISKEHINECKKLTNLSKLALHHPDYFINPILQVHNDLIETMSVLNSIWGHIIKLFTEGKNKFPEKYKELIRPTK